MSIATSSFRLIVNGQEAKVHIKDTWHNSPCWHHGCIVYWDTLPGGARVQHGENPEAVQEFAAWDSSEWIDSDDIYAWLAAIHAYEAPR